MRAAARSVTSKVADILGAVTNSPYRSLSEIARVTGLPLSTVHRLLRELVVSGLIQRSEHGNYSLSRWGDSGATPIGAPSAVMGPDGGVLRELGRPVLHDLAAASKRHAHLGLLDQLAVSQGDPIGSFGAADAAIRVSPPPHLPLHASALGKALLAYLPDTLLATVTAGGLRRYTPQTIVEPDELRAELLAIRRSGIACSWGEYQGDSAAAVIVLDPGGSVVAAIALEVFGPDDVPKVAPALLLAARTLTRRLGAVRVPPPAAAVFRQLTREAS